MAAPTLLDYAESVWSDDSTGSNIETTDDLDWSAAGDVIVVLGATEDQSVTLATPTGTGITLAALSGLPTATGNSCKVYGWSATAAGNGNTVLTCNNVTLQARGLAAWAFGGVSALGTPVVGTSTAVTVSVTVQADSSVVMVLADWNATADVAVTTEPVGGTVREATMVSGKATFLVVEWHSQAAGTRNYGVSAWTGTGTVSKAAVEVRGITSSSTTASAQNAAGVGAAAAPTTVTGGAAEVATAAAVGADPVAAVVVAGGSVTAAAGAGDVSAVTAVVATAEVASVLGGAGDATVVTVPAVAASAGAATAAGGADAVAAIVTAAGGVAAGAGGATDAVTAAVVQAGVAAAAGAAGDVTAVTVVAVTASAEVATAAAAADDAGPTTAAVAEVASAVGAGFDAAVDSGVPPVTESLFTSDTPTLTNQSDGAPGITAAVTVRFTEAGEITHVRWYCTTDTGGTWTGKVWQVTAPDETGGAGTELASEVFAGTPTGGAWNTIALATPVTVTPNTVLYKIGIHNDQGRYVATANFPAFVGGAGGVTTASMHAPHNGDNPLGDGNVYQGSFLINAAPGYPTLAGNAANYFADLVFVAAAVTAVVADAQVAQGAGSAADASVEMQAFADAAGAVAAAADAGVALVVAAEPSNGVAAAGPVTLVTAGTAVAEVAAAAGGAADAGAAVVVQADVAAAAGVAVAPSVQAGATESLFTDQVPTLPDQSDGAPGITTATTLRFSADGQITHVRWYCTVTTSGTWTGKVWRVTAPDEFGGAGTELASEVFAGTPVPGWNTIALPSPVPVTANTVLYKVGIHNDQGRYVATPNTTEFIGGGGGIVNGSIHAPHNGANPLGDGNLYQGSFLIGASPGYPTQSGNASNYLADVVFAPSVPVTAPAEVAAAAGAAGDAGGAVVVAAESAAAAGTAPGGSVLGNTTTASAEVAEAAGSAPFETGVSLSITMVSDGPVDAVGAALHPTTAIAVAAGVAAAAGDAGQPTVATSGTVTAAAGAATAAGSAGDVVASVGGQPETASAGGAANQPTISTPGSAVPGVAAGVASAVDVTAAIVVAASVAGAVAAAGDPVAGTGGAAEAAGGVGSVDGAATAVVVAAGAATGGAAANQPDVDASGMPTLVSAEQVWADAVAFDVATAVVVSAQVAGAGAAAVSATVDIGGLTAVIAYPHRVVRAGVPASVRRSM